ncbi:MAG: hypothetical protein P4L33_08935 [Capsulimonadaceae bacterium]|nr:hypothetical protein [Capsulimonadaceae bacterium]
MGEENNTIDPTARKRRRVHKRKPILGLLPRFGLLGTGLALLLIMGGLIVGKLIDPYQKGAVQQRQIAELRTDLNATRTKNEGLQQRRDALYRPEGIEVAARSEGYLRKGEVRLVLERDPTPLPERAHSDSILDRWRGAWLGFVGR